MRINPINIRYNSYPQLRNAGLKVSESTEPIVSNGDEVSFKAKPMTKLCGGISGAAALLSLIITSGAASLPALTSFAICTGVGFFLDKKLKTDDVGDLFEDKNNDNKSEQV